MGASRKASGSRSILAGIGVVALLLGTLTAVSPAVAADPDDGGPQLGSSLQVGVGIGVNQSTGAQLGGAGISRAGEDDDALNSSSIGSGSVKVGSGTGGPTIDLGEFAGVKVSGGGREEPGLGIAWEPPNDSGVAVAVGGALTGKPVVGVGASLPPVYTVTVTNRDMLSAYIQQQGEDPEAYERQQPEWFDETAGKFSQHGPYYERYLRGEYPSTRDMMRDMVRGGLVAPEDVPTTEEEWAVAIAEEEAYLETLAKRLNVTSVPAGSNAPPAKTSDDLCENEKSDLSSKLLVTSVMKGGAASLCTLVLGSRRSAAGSVNFGVGQGRQPAGSNAGSVQLGSGLGSNPGGQSTGSSPNTVESVCGIPAETVARTLAERDWDEAVAKAPPEELAQFSPEELARMRADYVASVVLDMLIYMPVIQEYMTGEHDGVFRTVVAMATDPDWKEYVDSLKGQQNPDNGGFGYLARLPLIEKAPRLLGRARGTCAPVDLGTTPAQSGQAAGATNPGSGQGGGNQGGQPAGTTPATAAAVDVCSVRITGDELTRAYAGMITQVMVANSGSRQESIPDLTDEQSPEFAAYRSALAPHAPYYSKLLSGRYPNARSMIEDAVADGVDEAPATEDEWSQAVNAVESVLATLAHRLQVTPAAPGACDSPAGPGSGASENSGATPGVESGSAVKLVAVCGIPAEQMAAVLARGIIDENMAGASEQDRLAWEQATPEQREEVYAFVDSWYGLLFQWFSPIVQSYVSGEHASVLDAWNAFARSLGQPETTQERLAEDKDFRDILAVIEKAPQLLGREKGTCAPTGDAPANPAAGSDEGAAQPSTGGGTSASPKSVPVCGVPAGEVGRILGRAMLDEYVALLDEQERAKWEQLSQQEREATYAVFEDSVGAMLTGLTPQLAAYMAGEYPTAYAAITAGNGGGASLEEASRDTRAMLAALERTPQLLGRQQGSCEPVAAEEGAGDPSDPNSDSNADPDSSTPNESPSFDFPGVPVCGIPADQAAKLFLRSWYEDDMSKPEEERAFKAWPILSVENQEKLVFGPDKLDIGQMLIGLVPLPWLLAYTPIVQHYMTGQYATALDAMNGWLGQYGHPAQTEAELGEFTKAVLATFERAPQVLGRQKGTCEPISNPDDAQFVNDWPGQADPLPDETGSAETPAEPLDRGQLETEIEAFSTGGELCEVLPGRAGFVKALHLAGLIYPFEESSELDPSQWGPRKIAKLEEQYSGAELEIRLEALMADGTQAQQEYGLLYPIWTGWLNGRYDSVAQMRDALRELDDQNTYRALSQRDLIDLFERLADQLEVVPAAPGSQECATEFEPESEIVDPEIVEFEPFIPVDDDSGADPAPAEKPKDKNPKPPAETPLVPAPPVDPLPTPEPTPTPSPSDPEPPASPPSDEPTDDPSDDPSDEPTEDPGEGDPGEGGPGEGGGVEG